MLDSPISQSNLENEEISENSSNRNDISDEKEDILQDDNYETPMGPDKDKNNTQNDDNNNNEENEDKTSNKSINEEDSINSDDDLDVLNVDDEKADQYITPMGPDNSE